MIAEIGSLLTSSKVAYDIAKGISALKSEVDRNESISKILEVLLTVQTNALSVNAIAQELQQEKYNLEKKILEFENWTETERQYELKEIATGIFVYTYKKSKNLTEPMHWLCAKCYNERAKSILQRIKKTMAGVAYACHNCKSEILDHSKAEPPQNYNPPSKGGPNSWMGA